MFDLTLYNLFSGIATDLQAVSLIKSFGYGGYPYINATSERPYPLLWLESDTAHSGTLTTDLRQTATVRVAIDLLDQISTNGNEAEFAFQIATIKTKLMETWVKIFSMLAEIENYDPFMKLVGGWSAAPLERVKNDSLFGFRFEVTFEWTPTPNDCAYKEITGDKTIGDYLGCQ